MSAKKITITFSIAALFVAAVGLVWLSNFSGGFSAREQPSALEGFVADQARRLAVPTNARKLQNPVPYSEQILEEGRTHWADHCAFCHANDGSGDTDVGHNLHPRAPDMRQSRTQAMTDGELYFTIENGVRLTGMPAWGKGTSYNEDSWKLVYFIRHLPKMTAQEVEEMKKLTPRSPMELMEEQQEDRFLNEESTKGTVRSNSVADQKTRKEEPK